MDTLSPMWVKTQKDRLNYCNSMVWNCLEYFDFNLVFYLKAWFALGRLGRWGRAGDSEDKGLKLWFFVFWVFLRGLGVPGGLV